MSRILAQTDRLERLPRNTFLRSGIPICVCVLLALGAQFCLVPAIGDFHTRILMDIGIAIMLAVSLNIVNGFTGQFSIGHAGFLTLGGYTAGALTYYGSLLIWGNVRAHAGFLGTGEQLFVLGCLAGGLVAAIAGYVVGLPTMRLSGDYLAIVTLGFGEIVRVSLQQTNPVLNKEQLQNATMRQLFPPPVGGALGFSGIPNYTSLFWVVLLGSLTILASVRIKQSSLGRAFISIREDEIAAQAMGIDVARLKSRAFVISAFFAGIAGGLYAHELGIVISPKDAGFQRSFDIVIMTVLGGMGSISGAVLAAAFVTVLPEFRGDFAQYRLIIFALLLILIMILRPQGLFGFKEIWDYFPAHWRGRGKVDLPK